jgi:Glyoxalase/Bleomycin resistance protein/Dioxygenase superfamily
MPERWDTRRVANPIRALRVEHLNIVQDDYEATVDHYRRLFGGVVVFDRLQPTWHACLVDVGGVLFEIFVPNEFFLHTRYGPHYLGVEYHVADIAPVRETLAAGGIRIARDLGVAVHAHPADCHGVSLEFFDDSFHDNEDLLDRPMQSAAYWRDDHPLGCTGLRGYTVAVADMAGALADFQAVLHHEVLYEERRDALGATGVGLLVGGAVLELVAPDGAGLLQQHLRAHGEGIRSTVFTVSDLERARRHFVEHGIEVVPGTAPDTFAIPAEQNRGVIFEFAAS